MGPVPTLPKRGARTDRRAGTGAPGALSLNPPLSPLTRSSPLTIPQIGIVGLPNVGKSTLFNVLTKMGIPAENFPFCTIEPNAVSVGRVCFSLSLFPPPLQAPQNAPRSRLLFSLSHPQARVNVPDDRFRWLVDLYKPKSAVPAFLEVVDIAGLVKGAATGEGLGNAFLSHIAGVDGIFHVCRAFEDAEVVHVEDRVDPVEDLEIIHG